LANHSSALKRAKQSEVRRLRNRTVKTRVKTYVKSIYLAMAEKTTEKAAIDLNLTQSVIDKAAQKGVIHKRTAARKISRLSKLLNSRSA